VWKEKDVAAGVSGDHSSAEWEGQLRWQQESSTRNGHVQQDGQPFKGMYQQEQKQQQQPREPADGAAAETCGEHSQQQPPPPQQQQQQQKAGPGSQQQGSWLRQKQQRLMRWLRSPTADWSAADWSFDDGSESVLVLQLLMADGRVAAVSVRDDKQPAKPTKVGRLRHAWCGNVAVNERRTPGALQNSLSVRKQPDVSRPGMRCSGGMQEMHD
jgi:hypothetical protein